MQNKQPNEVLKALHLYDSFSTFFQKWSLNWCCKPPTILKICSNASEKLLHFLGFFS